MVILGRNCLKKNILGVTFARGGSKGIKNKNLSKLMENHSFIAIKEAKKCEKITKYIISTDSLKIKRVTEKYKAEVPFLRPKNFLEINLHLLLH